MTPRLELILLNQKSEIARLQDQLETFGQQQGLARRGLHQVQLALEEHLTNILTHGYLDTAEHRIGVRLRFEPPELRIEVEDDARPFNPLDQPAPDLTKPIEERPIGGLGIHMMRKSLDAMEYRREGGKNVLVMIKRI